MKKYHRKHTAPLSSQPKKSESLASLAEGMADDFNNILTTVMGACSLIDTDDPANAELLQYVALIRTSAERAADLSNRLMRAGTAHQNQAYSGRPLQEPHSAATSKRDKKNGDDVVSTKNISGGTPP